MHLLYGLCRIALPWFWAIVHSFTSIRRCRIMLQWCQAILHLFASIGLCRIKEPCYCVLFCTCLCFTHGLVNWESCMTSSWPCAILVWCKKFHRVWLSAWYSKKPHLKTNANLCLSRIPWDKKTDKRFRQNTIGTSLWMGTWSGLVDISSW